MKPSIVDMAIITVGMIIAQLRTFTIGFNFQGYLITQISFILLFLVVMAALSIKMKEMSMTVKCAISVGCSAAPVCLISMLVGNALGW